MTSDTDSSHRKHHRSPSDEEIDKSSKRHKHRHHHRHQRRHHRSKKDGDDSKEIGNEIVPSQSLTAVTEVPVANSNRGCDDDVEEGEILDDDAQNLVDNGNGVVGNSLVGVYADSDPQAHANGDWDLGDKHHHKEGKKREKESSSIGNRKIISYHDIDVDESKSSDLRKSSSSDSHVDRHRTRSSSRDGYRDEVRSRSRSMSRDLDRGRSHSRSVLEEELLKSKRRKDVYEDASDDDRMNGRTKELWHDNREHLRDVERRSTSKYSKYHEGESRHYSLDVHVKDGKEGEMDKERKRGKERDRSRDRDVRREKEQERGRDRDDRREREHGRSWDRDRQRETDLDLRRERERGRSKERLMDRERRRESTRDRSMDNEMDRERRREKLRESKDREDQRRRTPNTREKSIDRDSERDRERVRARDRYRDKDRLRDHDRESEREKERERDRDKEREMWRDVKSDKDWDIKTSKETSNSLNVGSFDDDRAKLNREQDEQEDFEERIALKLVEQEEEDLERIKEESRKRRQAILEKYKNKQLQQQNQIEDKNLEGDKQVETAGQPAIEANVAKDNLDLGLDGGDVYVADPSFSVDKSLQQNGLQASERAAGAGGLGQGTPKSERSSENKYYDDIFGESPAGIRKSVKGDGLPVTRSGLHDNWDDAEGYYSYRFGEVLDGRYEIAAAHGKGVFSTVVRAKDLKAGIGDPEEVAVKIIRNNETMHKAGQLEVQILNKLGGADPENKRHCVRLLSSFKYRNHLCLVFESLHMNLREVLKKFGRNIGLKLTAIRAYAKQLFIALKHLKNCGVLHCDIKPDNMLVNEAKNVLKLCDFGNAMFAGKNEITPYLVSRFYRAPEIILGLPYDHPMDIWSVGCCLYELYTGKVLFPGPTNNDMLRLHMELKGPFPKKMLRKGAFVEQHFDQDLNFFATEEDPVTRKIIKRMIVNIKPKDIGTIISGSSGEDPKMLANFKDLLDKIFILDPEKRLTVHQALAHPFITGK